MCHQELMKKTMIKGIGDWAMSLCDKDTHKDDLENLKEVLMENEYEEEIIKGIPFRY